MIISRRRRLGSNASLIMLMTMLGCTKWVVQPLAPLPRKPPSSEDPVEMRVTVASGAIIAAVDPWVEHDSLLWIADGGDTTHRVGVPVATVRGVEARRPDLGNSLLMFFGVMSAVLGGLAAYIALSW